MPSTPGGPPCSWSWESATTRTTPAIFDTARDEVGGTGPGSLFVEGPDGACLRTVSADGAFLAWTRGRYYSAHAKGGEKDLDAFAQAFPF